MAVKIPTNKIFEISNRFNQVQSDYVELMAKHIKSIGKLTPEDVANISKLEEYSKMERNIKTITEELMATSKKTLREITKIYMNTSKELYNQAAKYYKWQNIEQSAFARNKTLRESLEKSVKSIGNNMISIIDGAGKAIKTNYAKAIDDAIEVVSSGKEAYTKEITKIVKQCAGQGVQVVYPSGYTRRLDSSVRMNLLDGVRSVRNNQARLIGKEFGANGVEIDAHGMCAEDHQSWQGKQYALNKEDAIKYDVKVFDESSGTVANEEGRPIGDYNCTHGLSYIILGVSDPVYSKKQLRQMIDYSNAKVKIGDKEMTRYEASQVMRQLETKMRDTKTTIIATGSNDLKDRLKETKALYNQVANKAGLPTSQIRASVPGYKG